MSNKAHFQQRTLIFSVFSVIKLAIPLILSLSLLSSCGKKEQGQLARDQATRDGILLFGNSGEPPSIDPHLNTSLNGSRITSALVEGLIAYHPTDDNLPEPGVAESWEDIDSTIWTFHLRKNARWSNGDPVTAQDFVYSYRRMLTPELGAKYAQLLHIIKNAREYNEGTLKDFGRVGVKALDDYTLELTLAGPTPHLLNLIKHPTWSPVHPATIEAYGGIAKPDSNWTRESYVGNGPYQLKNWVINKTIEVEKNPFYWDAEKVSINEIHFLPIDDVATEDQVFNSGRLHYQNTVPPDMIPIYRKENDPYLRMEPWIATYFYKLNTTEPALSDKRVRQALSLAINRKAIVKRVTKGDQNIALSITPDGIQGYYPPKLDGFNPNKARELLAAAGYPNGKGLPKLTILFNTSEQHKQIAEAIQQMWLNVLGVESDLENQVWKTFIDTQHNLDYQISRSGWIGDYVFPDTFLAMFRSGDGNNNTGWSNARYDELINGAITEPSAEKRLAMLHEAESILMEDQPIIPLYHYNRIYRIDPAVKGWYPKITDNRNYKYISLQEVK
ncbi:peptide ABC transporter substrate-binding protein [Pelagicoccus enzymogenes]|uniref:peptide ABC transporter substrate-binding protein n=1 Tax=Pelagicoccus enzymogenes TaxID=2773457 RepID=UPI00280F42A7|nr:peptide ABC transporter substrate-binding protein [Pelagicoccus enzymogenes]MDQ8196895.1 peptide ABC transporter substrate-binding protein [Pelagicoccus enzymogenes]